MGKRRAQAAVSSLDLSEMAVVPSLEVERVETGVLALDAALGGGLPYGSVVVIGGKEDVGKTNLALSIVANAVRAGYYAIYFDVENRLLYNPTRFTYKRLSEEHLKQIEIIPGENAVENVAAHIRARLTSSKAPIRVVVIDSLASLHTRSFRLLRESMQDGGVGIGAVARAITEEMRDIFTYYAHTFKVLFVITTQMRTAMAGGPHMELYGARYIRHAAATIIRISQVSKPQLSYDDPIPDEVTIASTKKPTFAYLQMSLDKCQLAPAGVRLAVLSRMFLVSVPQYNIFLGDYDNIFQLMVYGRRRPHGIIEKQGDAYVLKPTSATFRLVDVYKDEVLRNRILEESKPHFYEMFKRIVTDAFTAKFEKSVADEEDDVVEEAAGDE